MHVYTLQLVSVCVFAMGSAKVQCQFIVISGKQVCSDASTWTYYSDQVNISPFNINHLFCAHSDGTKHADVKDIYIPPLGKAFARVKKRSA